MLFTCVSLGDWGFKFYEAFWKCAENQIGKPNCLNLAGTVILLSLENQNSCLLILQYKKKKTTIMESHSGIQNTKTE